MDQRLYIDAFAVKYGLSQTCLNSLRLSYRLKTGVMLRSLLFLLFFRLFLSLCGFDGISNEVQLSSIVFFTCIVAFAFLRFTLLISRLFLFLFLFKQSTNRLISTVTVRFLKKKNTTKVELNIDLHCYI